MLLFGANSGLGGMLERPLRYLLPWVHFEGIPEMDRTGISRVKDSPVEARQISVPLANLDVGLRHMDNNTCFAAFQ